MAILAQIRVESTGHINELAKISLRIVTGKLIGATGNLMCGSGNLDRIKQTRPSLAAGSNPEPDSTYAELTRCGLVVRHRGDAGARKTRRLTLEAWV